MTLGFENETMEFKKSTGELKEAVASICAILNKHGYGELFIYASDPPLFRVICKVVTT